MDVVGNGLILCGHRVTTAMGPQIVEDVWNFCRMGCAIGLFLASPVGHVIKKILPDWSAILRVSCHQLRSAQAAFVAVGAKNGGYIDLVAIGKTVEDGLGFYLSIQNGSHAPASLAVGEIG